MERHQDKTWEEISNQEATKTGNQEEEDDGPALQPGEEAQSLTCQDCGRRLRSTAQAEFHAAKTQHVNFAESTEEIAPLTEEEKKAKLEELRQKLAEKRAGTSAQDKLDQKRNEVCRLYCKPRGMTTNGENQEIRRKSTKQTQDIKEDLQKKEQIKEAAKKRQEKQDDIDAKARIKAKIAADKEERRVKAAAEKAEREGRAPPEQAASGAIASAPAVSKPASAYVETRLRLQTTEGSVQKAFPVDTTLFEVAAMLSQENGIDVQSFTQNFPKKVFSDVDFGATLKELGLVPSASLIVK